ncbi:hypothetical protein L1887_18560 [Cichorium endivia]|nr:hypothetical protein L1887_18560 [Cichorium endivia]
MTNLMHIYNFKKMIENIVPNEMGGGNSHTPSLILPCHRHQTCGVVCLPPAFPCLSFSFPSFCPLQIDTTKLLQHLFGHYQVGGVGVPASTEAPPKHLCVSVIYKFAEDTLLTRFGTLTPSRFRSLDLYYVLLLGKSPIRSNMDEEYDVIVLGTGLKECILSGLLSVDGLKVLHMDRNDYYGGESTSLNLIQLWKKFRGSDKPPAHLGSSRDYNVDMIPKFIMANGALVRVLIHTDVTKYLYFKAVDGSFVYNKGKVHKVPATDMEALKSPLMGIFEKRRARKFFIYVQDYNESDPKTHEGMDLTRVTTKELIAKYGLDDNTVDFIGHALALHRDDRYLYEPALDTVKRMKLYAESLARFQGGSPYIYPLYGLGELPQAFARLSAVYGGTYMLNKPECKVEFDEEGKVCGVTSEGETAKCKKVVCDPSYLPNKVRKVGKVARAICIMSHPIPNTNESHSVQVILPQKQLGRRSDMYLFCCSYSHNVAPKGKFIAFVSTEAESDNPEVELKPGLDLLGPVDEIFYDVYDRYEPVNEPSLDNCFISTSYDATTHFESTVIDVLNMYSMITGKVLDLNVDLSAASAAEE